MRTYQYHSQIFDSDVQVSYNDSGLFYRLRVLQHEDITKLNTALSEVKIMYLEKEFLERAKEYKLKYWEVEQVVTFDMFWKRYAHTKCGYTKTEKKWNTMSKVDQVAAYNHIPRYESILKEGPPYPAKLYATTYLNETRWK